MTVVPVFISSTFRDFQRERDELNMTIRPMLDELIAPLGCRVELIDLRWGIVADDDDEAARHDRILDVCLSEIARAEPLFVGLVGDRFGWVAPKERMDRAALEAGMGDYPRGSSVTALEFEYGALRDRSQDALFLERQADGVPPHDWQDEDQHPVSSLKMRIRERCPVHVYRVQVKESSVDMSDFIDATATLLGKRVLERAKKLVGSSIDQVTAATDLFFDDRLRGFGGRSAVAEEVLALVQGGQSCCLTGESGAGKSAIWCWTVDALRRSGHRVVAVPVAVAPAVSTMYGVLRRLCTELGSVPDSSASLEALSEHLRGLLTAAGPVVIALDGLDQFPDDTRLNPLAGLPSDVRILASTTRSDQADYVAHVGVQLVPVTALSPESTRVAIESICSSIGRALPGQAIDALASRRRSPLWLRLAVGELLALGADDFSRVNPNADPLDEVARLISSSVEALPPESTQVIDRILRRVAATFGDVVYQVVSLSAVSRSGLRPLDLEQLVGVDALALAGIRRGLAMLLTPRREGGRLGFTHAVIRNHVRASISDAEMADLHTRLVAYLATVEDDPLCTADRLWHAFRARHQAVTVAEILSRAPDAERAAMGAVIFDSIHAPLFGEAVQQLSPRGVGFLASTAHRYKSEATARDRVILAFNIFDAAKSLLNRGDISDTAIAAFSDAAGCLADLPNAVGIDLRGPLTAARDYSQTVLATTPDSIGLREAVALTNMAVGGKAALIDACSNWEVISRSKPGPRTDSWYQYALTLLGNDYSREDDYNAAREAYLRALPMAERAREALGSMQENSVVNVVHILTNLGGVAAEQGQYPEARDRLERAYHLARAEYEKNPNRGNRGDMASTAKAYGKILLQQGEEAAARECLDLADKLRRKSGRVDRTDPTWELVSDTVGLAALADLHVGATREAAVRLQSYLEGTPDPDAAFRIATRLYLRNARLNTSNEFAAQIAQLFIDTAAFVARMPRVDQPGRSRADLFAEAAADASARVSGDSDDTYGPHVAMVCDALDIVVMQRAKEGGLSAASDQLTELVELRYKRLDRANDLTRTERARDLGRILLFEAFYLRGDDRAQAASNIADLWRRYLSDDAGNETDNPTLARDLALLAVNEKAQADELFPAALRYANFLVQRHPDDSSYRFDLVGILDTTGVFFATTGRPSEAVDYWIQAASTLDSIDKHEKLRSLSDNVARNLRRVSNSRLLTRSRRKDCRNWAKRLEQDLR